MDSQCVAIIPARGGSKRVPRKNIKNFHGKPLIAYSIEVALKSGLFKRVIVSTDDEEIAKVAKEYGAEVPFMRPKELSDDFSGTQAVTDHALEYLKAEGELYQYICTIYPTAPFLEVQYLQEGFEKLQKSGAVHAFSATTMPFPVKRTFKVHKDGRCEMFWPEYYNSRSQDLEEAYQDAGQFYWQNLSKIVTDVMFSPENIAIILPRHLVQDIDTPEDFTRAELMYGALHTDEV